LQPCSLGFERILIALAFFLVLLFHMTSFCTLRLPRLCKASLAINILLPYLALFCFYFNDIDFKPIRTSLFHLSLSILFWSSFFYASEHSPFHFCCKHSTYHFICDCFKKLLTWSILINLVTFPKKFESHDDLAKILAIVA
jgi:hypothetical protein